MSGIGQTTMKIDQFVKTCSDQEKISKLQKLKSIIEKFADIDEVYSESSGAHFTSCIWANPAATEGPDTCECSYIQRHTIECKQLMELEVETLSSVSSASQPSNITNSSDGIKTDCLQFICSTDMIGVLIKCTISLLGIICHLVDKK